MEAIAPRHALPSNATVHDLYSHWYPLYAKLHCLAAACEHMRRSCCPRRVESEVFMRECMCSCSRTYLGHQASPANTKGGSPRSTSIISASVLYSARSCANRMHTQFFSGASFSHAVFNGDRRRPVCGPGCACGVRTVRCRHTARAFARGLPLFSEKQTAVTMNAYLALQRVTYASYPRALAARMCTQGAAHAAPCLSLPLDQASPAGHTARACLLFS